MLKKLTNKKGFTLMEMLIVVAIIAVLVALAILSLIHILSTRRSPRRRPRCSAATCTAIWTRTRSSW